VDIGLIPAGHNTVRIIEIKERSSVPTEAALDRRDTDLRQCAGLAVLLKHPDDRKPFSPAGKEAEGGKELLKIKKADSDRAL